MCNSVHIIAENGKNSNQSINCTSCLVKQAYLELRVTFIKSDIKAYLTISNIWIVQTECFQNLEKTCLPGKKLIPAVQSFKPQ